MEQVLLPSTAKSTSQQMYGGKHPNVLSAVCHLFSHSSLAARMSWPRQDLFGDLRVRTGIKLGLAGLLALFCTQMLGVPNDTWAILTVFVLMDAKYVGALALKASMRITGTIVGAIIGVWLASDFASTPVIFLSVFFAIIAFAGYEVAQVGARQVPYAYYLLGLTTLTIASEGVADPAHAWQTGVDRTEEILIGIISSLLVSSLVWPRYAREEFLGAGRAALKTIGQLFSVHAQAYVTAANASTEIQQLHRSFDQQVSRLKNLLQIGSRESAVFSARRETYNAFMVSLTNLFNAGLDLGRHHGEACFLEQLEPEMGSLFAAICEEFEILTDSVSPGEKREPSSMNEAFAAFEEKVHQIRDQGMLLRAPLQTAMDFAGEFAALGALRDELTSIHNTMEGLPGVGQPDSEAASCVRASQTSSSSRSRGDFLPTIDWSLVRVGIKGGIAVVIAIICLRWIHPPGAASVPTWSWLFVIFPRTFLQLSGDSDLRGFLNALRGSLILVVCAILLILTTPFLASYALMNLVLFFLMFAVGFLTPGTSGLSFWGLFTWLTIEAFVGTNPQVPVSSQTIIDNFIGLGFGMWIAIIVSRLLWPILPQKVLRHSLLAICDRIKALLNGEPHPERIPAQLAKLMVEALAAARQIRIAGCSENERQKLVTLIHALQMLESRISQLVSWRNLLPEVAEPIMRPRFAHLEIEFTQMLDACAECFREGDCSRELPAVDGALAKIGHAVQQIRDRDLLGNLSPETSLRLLDLVDRYQATADGLDRCGEILRTLRIDRYWGDYGL